MWERVREQGGWEGHSLFDLMPKNFSTINGKISSKASLKFVKLTQYFLSTWRFLLFLNEKSSKIIPLLFSRGFTTRNLQYYTRLEVHRRILEQKPAFPFQFMRNFHRNASSQDAPHKHTHTLHLDNEEGKASEAAFYEWDKERFRNRELPELFLEAKRFLSVDTSSMHFMWARERVRAKRKEKEEAFHWRKMWAN